MNLLLVGMLAALWLWLLSPGVLRDRKPKSPIASIDSFERYMDKLAPLPTLPAPGPEATVQPRPPRPSAARRRRLIITRLSALCVATLAVATQAGGWTWALPATAATLLTAYLLALALVRRRAEVSARLRHLPSTPTSAPTDAEADPDRHAQQA
jgi:hypothetical protein